MKYITAKIDLGEKETFQKYNGKFLEESDAQDLITVTEDTAIMKPVVSLDGSDVPLAYVICNAFPNDNVRNVLASIEDTSTMRANCSGPISHEEMKNKGHNPTLKETPQSHELNAENLQELGRFFSS